MSNIPSKQNPSIHKANKVYNQYVKPLEEKHKDKYVLVTSEGKTIFAATWGKLMEQASRIPSPDNFVFKVGDRVLGKLR
jgi:hypothetical protein